MDIRVMTKEDYDQVYDLWIHTPGMGSNTIDDSQEGIERYLRRNLDMCFVAEKSNQIVGVIIAGHDGRRGFIYHTDVLYIGENLVDAKTAENLKLILQLCWQEQIHGMNSEIILVYT